MFETSLSKIEKTFNFFYLSFFLLLIFFPFSRIVFSFTLEGKGILDPYAFSFLIYSVPFRQGTNILFHSPLPETLMLYNARILDVQRISEAINQHPI